MRDEQKAYFKALGNKIQMLRLNKGLSLEETAAECKLTPAKMSEIENGETDFKHVVLCKLGRLFGVEVAFIVRGIKT